LAFTFTAHSTNIITFMLLIMAFVWSFTFLTITTSSRRQKPMKKNQNDFYDRKDLFSWNDLLM
jgi:hypothetical protein